ncbi:MAG: hypothetical protein ABIW38_05855 [Ferruginibacter sp.]
MTINKHILSNYKQIGVFVLFFLHVFLTSVSFVKASAETNKYSESPGNLPQNHNNSDPEDNSRSNYSDVQEYHFSVRAKRCVNQLAKASGIHSLLTNNIGKIASDHYFTSSTFIVRPAYYSFLSLHNLF